MKQNFLPTLFVIILNWNLPDETIACVESIQAGSYPGVKIVLVDSASSDASVARFRERFADSICVIENSENLGFAGGVNVGIRYALAHGARFLLFLNNDTTIDAAMIEHLISTICEHPRAGLVGPVIYYAEPPNRIWRIGDRCQRWLPLPIRFPDRKLASARHNPFRLDYITACGMLVRREVFEEIGSFDERYFMYFEDADFCQRARQAGYEIWCAPQAKMWHKVSLSARKEKAITRYLQSWGRVEFYRSHTQGLAWRVLAVYLILKGVGITINDLIAIRGRKDHRRELILPMWSGIFDAFFHRSARRRIS